LNIFHSIRDFKSTKRTIVTLGTFDGVHIGHTKIIEKLLQNTSDCDCETLLLTFFPHPRMVLQDPTAIKLLNTMEEK
jgi:riboflavin kinase/FMN adenylyltransferase